MHKEARFLIRALFHRVKIAQAILNGKLAFL
ncbi:hypothetical protein NEOC95_002393 [Neochlamydia sp. AcF95]|nr:hypothetical protein [Neochlamydia sp. AcF95]